jgi:Glycosyltransferase family 87
MSGTGDRPDKPGGLDSDGDGESLGELVAADRAAMAAAWGRWWRLRPDRVVLVAAGVTALMVFGSWVLRRQCTGGGFDQWGFSVNFSDRYKYACYSDIQNLWLGRGIRDHIFPYVHGRFIPDEHGGNLVDGGIEYPVITGLFMWLTGLGADNDAMLLRISAWALLPFGLITTVLLARLAGWRVLIWAAAPAAIIYSVYNWDLLATACVAGAIYAAVRGRPGLAGALFGLGAATKIYPGFFLVPLILSRLAVRDWIGAARATWAAVTVWTLVNLPFILINPGGWWATYKFQSNRVADLTTNSIWFWGMPQITTSQLNHITPVLIGLAWVVACGVGWLRRGGPEGFPWLGVAGAMLCAFLLFNKVHSPQYTLWLLPFFVLLRVRWGWYVAYLAADVTLYVGLLRWYYDITQGADFGVGKQATVVGVWTKAVLLGLLYVVFLKARSAVRTGPTQSEVDTDTATAVPYATSGAPSSTPPAGSSDPSARTTSNSGRRMSRTTSTQ